MDVSTNCPAAFVSVDTAFCEAIWSVKNSMKKGQLLLRFENLKLKIRFSTICLQNRTKNLTSICCSTLFVAMIVVIVMLVMVIMTISTIM